MNRFLFTTQSGDNLSSSCNPKTLTAIPFSCNNLATAYPSPPLFPEPAKMLKIWLFGKKINNFSVKTVAALSIKFNDVTGSFSIVYSSNFRKSEVLKILLFFNIPIGFKRFQ